MSVVKWRDAYTETKSTLGKIKKELGTIAICETHGRTVYRNKHYIIVEQHRVSRCEATGDYFVIPKSLIIKANKKHKRKMKRK